MTTPRASIVRGPAIIQFKGITIYTKTDFVVRPIMALSPVESSMFGTVDQTVDDFMWQFDFQHDGQLIDAHIPVLWPYASALPGTSVMGAADSDIIIWSKAGTKITFKAGGVTQMPNIGLAPNATLIGPMQLTAIGKNDTLWNAEGKWTELEASAFVDVSFDKSTIKKMAYTGTWGAVSPWNAWDTEAGLNVNFNLSLSPDKAAQEGTIDYVFDNLTATVNATAIGIDEEDISDALDISDTAFLPGVALGTLTHNNTLSIGAGTGNPAFAMTGASLVDTSLIYGRPKRVGECTWQSTRTFATGVQNPLFTLSYSAA